MAIKIFCTVCLAVLVAFFLYLSIVGLPAPKTEIRKAIAYPEHQG